MAEPYLLVKAGDCGVVHETSARGVLVAWEGLGKEQVWRNEYEY